jgi:hypothetical protein
LIEYISEEKYAGIHGIYDNGKIKFKEKVLPEGKAKAEIRLEDEKPPPP